MAITYGQPVRHGNLVRLTVTSSLSAPVYYHWYIDGAYVASTLAGEYSFYLDAGEQVDVTALDTNNADYDPIANAPAGYPARRSIYWVRSTDTDVDYYRVEQQKDGGSWTEIGRVVHDGTKWSYSLLTPRLDDLSTYDWRVYPVDAAGNDGTVLNFDSEKIVRRPDAPDFEISYDEDTDRVTFSAA